MSDTHDAKGIPCRMDEDEPFASQLRECKIERLDLEEWFGKAKKGDFYHSVDASYFCAGGGNFKRIDHRGL